MRARDNPLATSKVLQVRYRLEGANWDQLLERLESLGWRGAIVGPHGSGKTTLLEDLEGHLAQRGFETRLCRLNASNRSLSQAQWRFLRRGVGPGLLVLLDGAEQLGWWGWRRFLALARRAAGVVITTHRPGRLPTLWTCATSAELLGELLGELLPEVGPERVQLAHRLHERHGGNVRLALRELYDAFANDATIARRPEPQRAPSRVERGAVGWCALCLGGALLGMGDTVDAALDVASVQPGALVPGQTTTLVVKGDQFTGTESLWTSFEATVEREPAAPESPAKGAIYRIVVPAATPVGVGVLRWHSGQGVSKPWMIAIDDAPSVAESPGHHALGNAQEIAPPVAVDGMGEELGIDFFRFNVEAGQRLAVEVMAQRLGSSMDPWLRLLDGQGRELVSVDDDPGLGPDARCEHVFQEAGRCVVEVRDASYRGGPGFRYRLRVGDFPIVTATFPLSVPAGRATEVSCLARFGPAVPSVTVSMPEHVAGIFQPVKRAAGAMSSYVYVGASTEPVAREQETNDTSEAATEIQAPCLVQGTLERAGDRDVYRLEGQAGQRWLFLAETRQIGAPCDIWMELRRADGQRVARMSVGEGNDGVITNTFDRAGPCYLVVEEANRLGGPDLAYQVRIAEWQADFELVLETDTLQAAPGGKFGLKIEAQRQGYAGPIALSVPGLEGVPDLAGLAIAEKKNETVIEGKIPADWTPGTLVHFSVTGRKMEGTPGEQRRASCREVLRQRHPGTRQFPSGMEERVALGILTR